MLTTEIKAPTQKFAQVSFSKLKVDPMQGDATVQVVAEITFDNMDLADFYHFLRIVKHPPLSLSLESAQLEMDIEGAQ